MKRENDNRASVQERTSIKDKSSHRNAPHTGRPNPSQNTINPNHGLNEDEQKRKTNQKEQDETTNAYAEAESKTGKSYTSRKESGNSKNSEKSDQKQ